jgi:hypothetical protein
MMALASVLLAGSSSQVLGTDPPGPTADKAWGGCQLSATTVAGLKTDLSAIGGVPNPDVSFVVVYVLKNDNDGQKLGSNATGPVVCRDPAAVGITAFDKNGEAGGDLHRLRETTDIPTQTDPGNATSIDILAAEEAFTLQYTLNDGANAGKIEKRVCLTTKGNVECFRIFPVGP